MRLSVGPSVAQINPLKFLPVKDRGKQRKNHRKTQQIAKKKKKNPR